MRNWRLLLLLRSSARSRPLLTSASTPLGSKVHTPSSLISPRVPLVNFRGIRFYSSSELAVEPTNPTVDLTDENGIAVLVSVFNQADLTGDRIKQELESNSIVFTHDYVLNALRSLQSAPLVARRLFKFVAKNDEKMLSSKSYNAMLAVLVENRLAREFWDMVRVMEKKGFGVSKYVYSKAMEKFEKEGLSADVEKLSNLYASGSINNPIESSCSRVCKVIRQGVWGDDVENRLKDLNVEFSSELVSAVVESVGFNGNKGLLFFRWLEESGVFKHNEQSYGALLRVLASEGSGDKFWRVVEEMMDAGCEISRETYVHALERFVKKQMIKDAVDLYELAMGGSNKPSAQDCTFLLKKVVVSKELDMDLFSRVLSIFKEGGNAITNSMFDAVLKSLTSVGRFGECNEILRAMKEAGYVPGEISQSEVAFQLGKSKNYEAATEFMDNVEEDGGSQDDKTWASLVRGYCLSGDLDKASETFRERAEKVYSSTTGYVLELVVSAYCRNDRAADAYKLVSEMVCENELQPWHSTYKMLISMLLEQGEFQHALDVFPLMKNQGFPPFLEPFIDHLSQSGSIGDAVAFLKAMTVKRFPSPAVFVRLYEAYFKAGRISEAQDLLSKSPKYIKNHADVLNLFCQMKSGETAPPPVMAAAEC